MATESVHQGDFDSSNSVNESIIADSLSLDEIPDEDDISTLQNYALLDGAGRICRFRSIFTKPRTARRVLVIFVGSLLSPVCPLSCTCLFLKSCLLTPNESYANCT